MVGSIVQKQFTMWAKFSLYAMSNWSLYHSHHLTYSAATLVHAFVMSRVDYCNAVLAAAPKTTTDRLQRVLNAAARVVSDTRKFDHGLSRLMHQELHWLDIPERVSYKLGILTHRCLLGKAPVYLSNCCIPVAQVATRRHLRTAAHHQLTVPRHHLST